VVKDAQNENWFPAWSHDEPTNAYKRPSSPLEADHDS
jgi:hypothetical protein